MADGGWAHSVRSHEGPNRLAGVRVFTPLPRGVLRKPPCYGNLQRLHRDRQRGPHRFAYQQMHMFRHDNVGIDRKTVSDPDEFERTLEDIACA